MTDLLGSIFKRCPRCGKEFLVRDSSNWRYKYDGKLYCSYTCWLRVRGVDRHGVKLTDVEKPVRKRKRKGGEGDV